MPSISLTATGPIRPMRWTASGRRSTPGARWVVLCDTNGGTLPGEIGRITGEVIASGVPGARLGIHTHNDTETAVASTLAAVDAGARQIQGTLNGLGERCGNANLVSLIPTLLLKAPYREPLRDRRERRGAGGADAAQPDARRHPEPGADSSSCPMSAPRPSPTRRGCMPARS